MRGPAARFYFGFGSTWKTLDAAITWTDVTPYVLLDRGCTVNRGRSSELDDYRAGVCSFTLENRGRQFDPSYTPGPYFGDLLPGVPVKIEGVVAGASAGDELLLESGDALLLESGDSLLLEEGAGDETFPVYRGFVVGWPQEYELSDNLPVVPVAGVDGFGKLSTAGTPSSVYSIEVAADTPKAWWRLGETAGPSLADSSGNRLDGTYNDDVHGSADHPGPWETVKAFRGDLNTRNLAPVVSDAQARMSAYPFTVEAIITVDDGFDNQTGIQTTSSFFRQGGADADIRLGCGLLANSGTGLRRWAVFNTIAGDGAGSSALGASTATNAELATLGPIHFLYRATAAATHSVLINGVELTTTSSATGNTEKRYVVLVGSNDTIPWQGVVADVAIYESELSDGRAAAHYEAFTAPWDGDSTGERVDRILDLAGWPTDLIDTATGVTTLGPATLGAKALGLLKNFEKAEQGRLFISRSGKVVFLDRYYNQTSTEGATVQATFSDDGADIAYSGLGFDFDARVVYNRVRGSRVGGATIETFDQTSIDTYGEQVESSLDGIQVGTDAEVRAATDFRLDRYREPQLRARPITVLLHGINATQQASVLGLELGYRVNLERTPNGVGAAIDQDTIVEGLQHNIGAGTWTVMIPTSPVDTRVYGLWGSGLWGSALWAY